MNLWRRAAKAENKEQQEGWKGWWPGSVLRGSRGSQRGGHRHVQSWRGQFPLQLHEQSLRSVQFSHSVMSDSLQPHGLQHTRPPCALPTPGVYPNSCPFNWWCHPTISSPIIPFSSCLQSFPSSGSFQMRQFSYQVAKVLEFQLQHQSFQWILRTDFL